MKARRWRVVCGDGKQRCPFIYDRIGDAERDVPRFDRLSTGCGPHRVEPAA